MGLLLLEMAAILGLWFKQFESKGCVVLVSRYVTAVLQYSRFIINYRRLVQYNIYIIMVNIVR